MDEHLSRTHRQPEGNATVGQPFDATRELPNKMVVSLLNVERETSGGIVAPVRHTSEGGYARTYPPLLLNLSVLLAAVYDERRYADSLSILSDTLGFVQSTPGFEMNGMAYTSELVNVSAQELNNIWTLFGGHYYPSVVCKIRRIIIDEGTLAAGGKTVGSPVVEM